MLESMFIKYKPNVDLVVELGYFDAHYLDYLNPNPKNILALISIGECGINVVGIKNLTISVFLINGNQHGDF